MLSHLVMRVGDLLWLMIVLLGGRLTVTSLALDAPVGKTEGDQKGKTKQSNRFDEGFPVSK